MFNQPPGQALGRIPMAVVVSVILNNETLYMNLIGFDVLEQAVVISGQYIGHSVVSNYGIGECQNLSSIARIGQSFRIAVNLK